MRPHCLTLLSLLVFASLSAAFVSSRSGALVGGWTTIKHINDAHITEIANFAVNEYNRQSGEKLKLVKVLSGQTQLVAGVNYRLALFVNYGTGTSNYGTLVYERAWENQRDLIYFAPLLRQ